MGRDLWRDDRGHVMTRVDYLLAELRCAALRARLWQADIESIGLALKTGWITPRAGRRRARRLWLPATRRGGGGSDWKEIAQDAWNAPGWRDAARKSKEFVPYDEKPTRGNGGDEFESGTLSLPDGIFCDGDATPTPRPKLIDGLLSTTGLCFLGGQGSAGKSFIAIAMAVALATGEPFFGRAVNEKVGTLVIAAEGREDMQARIAAAKKHLGIETDLPILWMAVPVFGDAFLKDLEQINMWMQAKHNVRLGMITLDTVSASFDLKEEDDNAEAARVCKVLRRIGEHIGAVMVPVHH